SDRTESPASFSSPQVYQRPSNHRARAAASRCATRSMTPGRSMTRPLPAAATASFSAVMTGPFPAAKLIEYTPFMTDRFKGRLLGVVEGCTNPESAELLDDGETIIFGNCRLDVGFGWFRDGQGLVYLEGQAFVSRARVSGDGAVTLDERSLISGLTT